MRFVKLVARKPNTAESRSEAAYRRQCKWLLCGRECLYDSYGKKTDLTSLASLASVAKGPISIAGHLQEAPRINIISIQRPVSHYHFNKRSTFARVMLAVLFAGCLFLSYRDPLRAIWLNTCAILFLPVKVVSSKVAPEEIE